jgi:hypothetical protein
MKNKAAEAAFEREKTVLKEDVTLSCIRNGTVNRY